MTAQKHCSKCSETKPVDGFFRNKSTKDGLSAYCKVCHAASRKVLRKKDPEAQKVKERGWSLKTKYGITPEKFDEMLKNQDGVCAICPTPLTAPVVDHCHRSGRVRGLLCTPCNLLLGNARDNPNVLMKAVEYLSKDNS